MREARVTFPELALIAGTRVALGAGLGLLLADRLSAGQRRAAGLALLTVGGLSTVPLLAEVLSHVQPSTSMNQPRNTPQTGSRDSFARENAAARF